MCSPGKTNQSPQTRSHRVAKKVRQLGDKTVKVLEVKEDGSKSRLEPRVASYQMKPFVEKDFYERIEKNQLLAEKRYAAEVQAEKRKTLEAQRNDLVYRMKMLTPEDEALYNNLEADLAVIERDLRSLDNQDCKDY